MSTGPILLLTVLLTGYIYFSVAQNPQHHQRLLCAMYHRNVGPEGCRYDLVNGPCGQTCPKSANETCGPKGSHAAIRNGICKGGLICCDGFCQGCVTMPCIDNGSMCPPKGQVILKKSYGASSNQIPLQLPLKFKYLPRYDNNRYNNRYDDYYYGSELEQYDVNEWEQ